MPGPLPPNVEGKGQFTFSIEPSKRELFLDYCAYFKDIEGHWPPASAVIREFVLKKLKEYEQKIDKMGLSKEFHDWRRITGKQRDKQKREKWKDPIFG